MAQHFLLSTKARTLSLAKVLRLTDQEAYDAFKAIRFSANGGEAFCPKCGCVDLYWFQTRKVWKCKGCKAEFSVTSGTIFSNRKLSVRDILAAIAIFTNGAKGRVPAPLGSALFAKLTFGAIVAGSTSLRKIRRQLSTLPSSTVTAVTRSFKASNSPASRARFSLSAETT